MHAMLFVRYSVLHVHSHGHHADNRMYRACTVLFGALGFNLIFPQSEISVPLT